MDIQFLQQNYWLIIILVIWELIWKGIGMWKSARASQRGWFIAILVVNSIGVIPILYILFFQKEKIN